VTKDRTNPVLGFYMCNEKWADAGAEPFTVIAPAL